MNLRFLQNRYSLGWVGRGGKRSVTTAEFIEHQIPGITLAVVTLPLYTVDAFTDQPFAGNPAGVCLLESDIWPSEGWMQNVAAEIRHFETAFLLKPNAQRCWPIRYFTPTVEVALCGHATLGSAHALWEHGHASTQAPLAFLTTEGKWLACERQADASIRMNLPADPPRSASPPDGLLDVLGVAAGGVDESAIARGRFDVLVRLVDADAVRSVFPDFAALAAFGVRGVVVTAPGGTAPDGRPVDFTSRFFAPGSGIDEDPVTGSAHCLLGPYWADHLGKTDLLAYQASARGGVLGVEVLGDHVAVSGRAVTVWSGQWRITPD